MTPRRKLLVLMLAPLVALLSWLLTPLSTRRLHARPAEGEFRDISLRFPWPLFGIRVPGYEITFDQFDLSKPYSADYRIGELPEIARTPADVFLCVEDPGGRFSHDADRRLSARVTIDVLDERGSNACHVEERLADMRWSWPTRHAPVFGLYSEGSFFFPRGGAAYRVRVRYIPDPRLSGHRGFVYMMCGGKAK